MSQSSVAPSFRLSTDAMLIEPRHNFYLNCSCECAIPVLLIVKFVTTFWKSGKIVEPLVSRLVNHYTIKNLGIVSESAMGAALKESAW